MDTEKDIRDWLRASDILIARIQTGREISKQEIVMLDAYLSRVRAVLLTLRSFQAMQDSRDAFEKSKV